MVKIMINVFSRGTDLPVNALCGKAGCITVAAACLQACFSQMITVYTRGIYMKIISKRLCRNVLLAAVLTLIFAHGTARAAAARPSADESAALRSMAGQLLLVGFRGESLSGADSVVRDVTHYNLGGVILFDRDVALGSDRRNIRSVRQLAALTAALQKAAQTPLFVAVDQEGGRVARLSPRHGFAALPSAQETGAAATTAASADAGSRAGAMLHDVGVNLNFAPVVDVNVRPDNPAIGRAGRSFSADSEAVARHAQAFLQGMASHGVLGCVKHFPGHGSSAADSHLGVADISASWNESELVPYRRLLDGGHVQMIMTGHLFNSRLDPDHPATLSRAVITGLLRGRLGFGGVVVSDDMQMKAITDRYGLEQAVALALNAGVDILLFGNNLTYDADIVPEVVDMIESLVERGVVPRSRIEESFARVLRLKESAGLLPARVRTVQETAGNF
jgi:beta-N-acetylhexosaminidase